MFFSLLVTDIESRTNDRIIHKNDLPGKSQSGTRSKKAHLAFRRIAQAEEEFIKRLKRSLWNVLRRTLISEAACSRT